MIGEMAGSYRIVRPLGEGGMGVVYVAEHPLLGREAVVKLLLPELSRHKESVERFFNEARASTLIEHPGIVSIFDFGYHPSGRAFIVMEKLPGESLAVRLRARGPLPEPEAFAIVRGIAGALAAAHAVGIVHRDLKPENIFLVPDPEVPAGERVKLLDFGIAKLTVEVSGRSASTRTGAVLGTPSYMSPEQCRGTGDIDHRADLYAVGCILFEMISGRLPFESAGTGEIIGAHQFVPPPPLRSRAPHCSTAAEALVAQLLAKAPADRVQTAQDLLRWISSHSHTTAGGSSHLAAASRGATAPGALTGAGGAPTTLGGAAGAHPTTAPRRRGWLVGATAAAVVAAGVAVAGIVSMQTQGRDANAPLDEVAAAAPGTAGTAPTRQEETPPSPSGSAGPAVAVDVPPAVTPPPEPTPAPDAPGAEPAPGEPEPAKTARRPEAVPASVPLKVTTVPAGADVVVDGKALGPSPIRGTIARSAAAARITLSREGYETRVVTVRRNGPIDLKLRLSPKASAQQTDTPVDKNRTVNPFED